ncbi:MAG: hypothetical protein E7540_05105 [Ruminococcaceae bacterium]|nr:hypothetical protein [Oscillospiraceae bacterium]
MKKLVAVMLSVIILLLLLVGCTSNLYYKYDMKEFVTLGDFSFEVDRNSPEYIDATKYFYTESFGTDLNYETAKGLVEYGDTVNINYVGDCNGKTFLHGTGVNFDLTIGSDSFAVPGFEDALIGAEIGKETSFVVTLPEDFINSEVAGKKASYNVTVNYAVKGAYPTDDDAKKYGFDSLKDYEDKVDRYAVGVCIFSNAFETAEIKDYPKKEADLLFDQAFNAFKKLCSENGTTVNKYVSDNKITLTVLKEHIMSYEVKKGMETYLVAYALLQKYEVKLTSDDIQSKRIKLEKKYQYDLLANGFDEINIEQAAAYDKAVETLYNYAVIK